MQRKEYFYSFDQHDPIGFQLFLEWCADSQGRKMRSGRKEDRVGVFIWLSPADRYSLENYLNDNQ